MKGLGRHPCCCVNRSTRRQRREGQWREERHQIDFLSLVNDSSSLSGICMLPLYPHTCTYTHHILPSSHPHTLTPAHIPATHPPVFTSSHLHMYPLHPPISHPHTCTYTHHTLPSSHPHTCTYTHHTLHRAGSF